MIVLGNWWVEKCILYMYCQVAATFRDTMILRVFANWFVFMLICLKGKFPQTTMWIGWVESNFTNPTGKVWADFDNPFKRSDYAKLCMSPSLDGTLPEYVISQEDNSPLTLYIHFHNFSFFLDIISPFDQVHSLMHAYSSQPKNIPKY